MQMGKSGCVLALGGYLDQVSIYLTSTKNCSCFPFLKKF
jgi:hypothetical protein